MKEDYIIMAVDSMSKVSIRLMSLKHLVQESLEQKKIEGDLCDGLTFMLLGSTILGSRYDDQESILFKLKLAHQPININCEVSPKGAVRSAILGDVSKISELKNLSGELFVARLKKNDQVYQSITQWEGSIENAFREYLVQSVQTDCQFWTYSEGELKYALWVERLPQTTEEEWKSIIEKFDDYEKFLKCVEKQEDPDVIIRNLFDDPIRILAVTKPKLICTCTHERVITSLHSLPYEELVELFMDGTGVTLYCEYCGKGYMVEDKEIQDLIKGSQEKH